MVLLVCGSRDWNDADTIRIMLQEAWAEGFRVLVHGAAPGADSLAGAIGRQLGFEVLSFPADWDRLGKKAGPVRNRQMLRETSPIKVLAFQNNRSSGTQDMINISKQAGKEVQVITGI